MGLSGWGRLHEVRAMRAFKASKQVRSGRPLARRCGGWGTAEYLVVLAGLMGIWRGAQVALTLIREHHQEFSWALMVPF
jgi:hypothetical protein